MDWIWYHIQSIQSNNITGESHCRILHETETLGLDSCMLKDTVNYSFAIHGTIPVTYADNGAVKWKHVLYLVPA